MIANRRTLIAVSLIIISLIAPLSQGSAAPPHQTTTITYNTVVTGQIFDNDEEDSWVFNGQEGELILIDMRATDPNLDTYLTFMGPSGNTLMTDDDGGEGYNSRIGPFTLPASGEYTIIAARYSGIGAYTLELTNLTTVPTIAPGKPLVGVVNAERPTNYFLLDTTTSDDVIMWRVEISDDQLYSDPHLSILGPNGLISSNEMQFDTSYLDPVVPLPGQPQLIMVSWNEADSGGPYEIVIHSSELELLNAISTQTGSFDYESSTQSHYFQAEADQQVRITVRTDDDISPAIEVTSLDYSAYLIYTDSVYIRDFSVTLDIPETTLYVVEVHNGTYDRTGTYTIEFEVIDG